MSNGVKYDDGKLDYTLLPYEALQEVVKVLMYGAKKYPEADNWKRVSDPRKRYNKAALRHLFAEVSGETIDKESGLYHLAHAVCSNLFALHFAIQDASKPVFGEPFVANVHRITSTIIIDKCNKCGGCIYAGIQHMCSDG